MGSCTDIHEQKELAEELELASNELSHRIKNIFAVISALITLSVREYPVARDFAAELRQRIESLGKAHDYARPHGKGSAPMAGAATVLGLIRQLLQPYEIEGHDRIVVEGDDGPLDHHASTPISLAVHELATNAAKYGAFSTAEGQVRVEGRLSGETYHICWIEQGGPPARAGALRLRQPTGGGQCAKPVGR
jgi:two-component sensor histidine kinase